MFLGTFEPNLDDKGRFTLPAPFRETLKEKTGSHDVVLTRGLDDCIFGFDRDQFQQIVDGFHAASFAKKRNRLFERNFFGKAIKGACDGMGRIRIPDALREKAGIPKKGKLVVIGASTRFEIWDKAAWERREAQDEEEGTYEEIAEDLF